MLLIDSNELSNIITFSQDQYNVHLQVEANWIIANLLTNDSAFQLLINKDIIKVLMQNSLTPVSEVLDQVLWSLKNLSVSDKFNFLLTYELEHINALQQIYWREKRSPTTFKIQCLVVIFCKLALYIFKLIKVDKNTTSALQ